MPIPRERWSGSICRARRGPRCPRRPPSHYAFRRLGVPRGDGRSPGWFLPEGPVASSQTKAPTTRPSPGTARQGSDSGPHLSWRGCAGFGSAARELKRLAGSAWPGPRRSLHLRPADRVRLLCGLVRGEDCLWAKLGAGSPGRTRRRPLAPVVLCCGAACSRSLSASGDSLIKPSGGVGP